MTSSDIEKHPGLMIKIIADKNIPFLEGILEPFAHIRYLEPSLITQEAVKNADALIIRTRTLCGEELLTGSSVRMIATATIGFDHIDTLFCRKQEIAWSNAPGCNAASVQQYIASALFTLAAGHHFCLNDLTIGIVGVGHVGIKVEKLARILGMKVMLNDPPRERAEDSGKFVSLHHLLAVADIVTLHVPLYPAGRDKTFHLVDRAALDMMKPGAVLINTSRGEVVEPEALKKAILSGRLKGTVLDVWENEPSPDPELLRLTSIATPHIAGYSSEGKAMGTAMAVRDLSRYFKFPLEEWFPEHLPPPLFPGICIDTNRKTTEEIIAEAVLHSYRIMEDDTRLRSDPSSFEEQRKCYPLRREFPAFSVKMKGYHGEAAEILQKTGFVVEVSPPPD